MIDPAYVQTMARYNAWQNASVCAAASGLSEDERRADRGAFFKSIHATLNHVLWADHVWLGRFTGGARPATPFPGVEFFPDWSEFLAARQYFDARFEAWAQSLAADDLAGDLVWGSALLGGEARRPKGLTVVHMFNHQSHHRGQVHALLTALGAKPQATDLILMAS
jgi:uncharacterized damage-inducible protein DinB